MRPFHMRKPSEQVADHLRQAIQQGEFGSLMPGVPSLAARLGVDPKTVGLALKLLEKDGLIESRGTGRPRRVVARDQAMAKGLAVEILCYERTDSEQSYILQMVHQLTNLGFHMQLSRVSLTEMSMDVKRVARHVAQSRVDAWIVVAGSRDVLEWFAAQDFPVFALFGRSPSLPIAGAGVVLSDAYRQLVRKLVELGHRRIVLLNREERRKPEPGVVERAFLEELEAQGIHTGSYHMPDWEESIDGLENYLNEVLRVTPPTAMIISQPTLFLAVQLQLAKRGIEVPRDMSLFCTSQDPAFSWLKPAVSCFTWDAGRLVKLVTRWARNVARGRVEPSLGRVKAKWFEGGTIGPAPGA